MYDIEQLKKIITDAAGGATHYNLDCGYLLTGKSGYMCLDESGDWDYLYAWICDTRSLDDIRTIINQYEIIEKQAERIAELEQERDFFRDFWIKRLEPYKSPDEMKILLMIEAEQLRKEQNND